MLLAHLLASSCAKIEAAVLELMYVCIVAMLWGTSTVGISRRYLCEVCFVQSRRFEYSGKGFVWELSFKDSTYQKIFRRLQNNYQVLNGKPQTRLEKSVTFR